MRKAGVGGLVIFAVFLLLSCAGFDFVLMIPFSLVVGWVLYLIRVIPQVTVSPSGIVIGLLALLVSIALCHMVVSWLWNHFHPARLWRPRWTLTCYSLVLFTFTAGICVVSITHQTYWIVSSPEPFVDSSWRIRDRARAAVLRSQLHTVRAALAQYRNDHQGRFPTLTTLSDWSALTANADASGHGAGGAGPYLSSIPANPFSDSNSVCAISAPNLTAGWAYDEATGEFRAILLLFHVRNLRESFSDTDAVLLR